MKKIVLAAATVAALAGPVVAESHASGTVGQLSGESSAMLVPAVIAALLLIAEATSGT